MGFTVFGILDSRPLLVLLASFGFWVCSLVRVYPLDLYIFKS